MCSFPTSARARRIDGARADRSGATASSTGSTAATSSFDDFLATFTAEKRKKAKRERRRVAEAGIEFDTRFGRRHDRALWRTVYEFYADTFYRHGHEPYLNLQFFKLVSARMPERLMLKIAAPGQRRRSRSRSSSWARMRCTGATGAPAAITTACISRPAITRASNTASSSGLERFEPGTQGEHKVPRGFVPDDDELRALHRRRALRRGDPRFRGA